jgi:hypothetical protein
MATMRQGRVLGLTAVLGTMAAFVAAAPAAAAAGEIHGKVTDQLGEPIAGITVCANGLTMFVGSECDWTTDAEGEYSITGLQAASYRVGFHVESNPSLNYVPQWYSGKAHPEEADPVELAVGESREINAQMQTGGQIKGRIADHDTDLPIEGVEVCANSIDFQQDGEFGYCDRSDAAGKFAVRNLGTGKYRLEVRTEGHVNYVETQSPEIPLTAGGVVEVEAHLVPGIEIEGTLTDAGTAVPIVGPFAPYSVPSVCALNSATEARVKCTGVESGGRYSIPGLPPGTYAVAFALDWVEEGLDLHPDGYVRRYWNEVPGFDEATLLSGSPGTVIGEVDAVLTKGEEVFPNCEVPSACPSTSDETSSTAGGITSMTTPLRLGPTVQPPVRRRRCKKGFRRTTKNGHTRCVKIRRKGRHHTMRVATASGATESVSLGSAEETGPEPAPLLEPAAVEDPVSFKVTFTATPVQSLLIGEGLNCIRGSETPGVPDKQETVTPPVSITLTAPAGSDSCLLTAYAETLFSGVFGTVRIEAEAVKASKSEATSPAVKKCKRGKKPRHGKCVRVKKKHPHRRKHKTRA